jgi:hypothetical protein
MATLLKVLNNLADIKSAGGVALHVRTQVHDLLAVAIAIAYSFPQLLDDRKFAGVPH